MLTYSPSTYRYISIIRPEAYPAVLRNLIIGALFINISVLIVTYSVLPSEMISNGANVLSSVAQVAGGTWLRKIVVVDSAIVVRGPFWRSRTPTDQNLLQLCGGVLVSLRFGSTYVPGIPIYRFVQTDWCRNNMQPGRTLDSVSCEISCSEVSLYLLRHSHIAIGHCLPYLRNKFREQGVYGSHVCSTSSCA